jgi:hypothetical protein
MARLAAFLYLLAVLLPMSLMAPPPPPDPEGYALYSSDFNSSNMTYSSDFNSSNMTYLLNPLRCITWMILGLCSRRDVCSQERSASS